MALWLPRSLVTTKSPTGPSQAPPMLCAFHSLVLLGLSTQQELKILKISVDSVLLGVGNPGGSVDIIDYFIQKNVILQSFMCKILFLNF